ncbi:MAG: flagellar motor switch protein FliM [Planctomycetaceae bacterium]|nr:flagellar motor switch protein FliM [Planctomycetaceae bacterium]
MNDVLGQSEIDALLGAVTDDAAPLDQADAQSPPDLLSAEQFRDPTIEIRPYDFKRPERVSKDQIRALQALHDTFARNFGASMSGFLRTIVEVNTSSIEQLTYGEFIQGLPNPTCFNLLDCEPLEGQMCLELSPLIVYPIIDRLLGGSSADLFIPPRPLTKIESRLVTKITDRAQANLTEAWAGVMPINFQLAETESSPQLVQIVPPNEVVVVVGFEMKMGDRAGTMSLCIPFNLIEPIIDDLANQGWDAYNRGKRDQRIQSRIVEKLGKAPLNAAAVLAETAITVDDLLNLEPGDLIMTDKPDASPLVFTIEGKRKFIGHLGQIKGKRAMQVQRPITEHDRV